MLTDEALVAAAALGGHVLLGRREGRNVPLAAALGIVTLLSALALVVLGAMLSSG